MSERFFRPVDKLNCCLNCHQPVDFRNRVSDHCYPQLMIKKPEGQIDPSTTPLRRPVLRQYNKFTFCGECGPKLDYKKIGEFADSQFKDVQPVKLVQFLRASYPRTSDNRLLMDQVYSLVRVNDQMIKAIAELPDTTMNPDLVDKYLEASEEVEKFTKALLNLQISRILDARVTVCTAGSSSRLAYLGRGMS
jgi:hypothetical protein